MYYCGYEQFVWVVVLGGWAFYVVLSEVDIVNTIGEDMYVVGLVFCVG